MEDKYWDFANCCTIIGGIAMGITSDSILGFIWIFFAFLALVCLIVRHAGDCYERV